MKKFKKILKTALCITLICAMLVTSMGAYSGEAKEFYVPKIKSDISINHCQFNEDIFSEYQLKINDGSMTKNIDYKSIQGLLEKKPYKNYAEDIDVYSFDTNLLNIINDITVESIDEFPNSYMISFKNANGEHIIAEYLKNGKKNVYVRKELKNTNLEKSTIKEKELLEKNVPYKVEAYFEETNEMLEYIFDFQIYYKDDTNNSAINGLQMNANSTTINYETPVQTNDIRNYNQDVLLDSTQISVRNGILNARIIEKENNLRQTNTYNWLNFAVGTTLGVISLSCSMPVSALTSILYTYQAISTVSSAASLIKAITIQNKKPIYKTQVKRCCDLYINGIYKCAYDEYETIVYTSGTNGEGKFDYVRSDTFFNTYSYFYNQAAYVYNRGGNIYAH